MNFSFNFFNDDGSVGALENGIAMEEETAASSIELLDGSFALYGPQCKQHFFDQREMISYVDRLHYTTIQIHSHDGSLPIKVLSSHQSRIDHTSDIIRGVYEGGYKVWECSLDLAQFMLRETRNQILPSPSTSSVIELGCGHGVPGMVALKLGYRGVVFSDLNEQVIAEATMPNIFLNFFSEDPCSDDAIGDVQCFSGDWEHLNEYFSHTNQPLAEGKSSGRRFDLILSAETLYNADCCRKLLMMIEAHLSDTGVALIASKRFYFGVGGGTLELTELIRQRSALSCEVLEVFEDGHSNIREIISLRRVS